MAALIPSTKLSGKEKKNPISQQKPVFYLTNMPHSIGVPQVILPCWMDTFDFANRAEYLGIGVYGSKYHTPRVETKELAAALVKVFSDTEEAASMRRKAKELQVVAAKYGGRAKAADTIVDIMEYSSAGTY